MIPRAAVSKAAKKFRGSDNNQEKESRVRLKVHLTTSPEMMKDTLNDAIWRTPPGGRRTMRVKCSRK